MKMLSLFVALFLALNSDVSASNISHVPISEPLCREEALASKQSKWLPSSQQSDLRQQFCYHLLLGEKHFSNGTYSKAWANYDKATTLSMRFNDDMHRIALDEVNIAKSQLFVASGKSELIAKAIDLLEQDGQTVFSRHALAILLLQYRIDSPKIRTNALKILKEFRELQPSFTNEMHEHAISELEQTNYAGLTPTPSNDTHIFSLSGVIPSYMPTDAEYMAATEEYIRQRGRSHNMNLLDINENSLNLNTRTLASFKIHFELNEHEFDRDNIKNNQSFNTLLQLTKRIVGQSRKPNVCLAITGHADQSCGQMNSSDCHKFNMGLSRARAETIANRLKAAIAKDRTIQSYDKKLELKTRALGDSDPVTTSTSQANGENWQNRRVQLSSCVNLEVVNLLKERSICPFDVHVSDSKGFNRKLFPGSPSTVDEGANFKIRYHHDNNGPIRLFAISETGDGFLDLFNHAFLDRDIDLGTNAVNSDVIVDKFANGDYLHFGYNSQSPQYEFLYLRAMPEKHPKFQSYYTEMLSLRNEDNAVLRRGTDPHFIVNPIAGKVVKPTLRELQASIPNILMDSQTFDGENNFLAQCNYPVRFSNIR